MNRSLLFALSGCLAVSCFGDQLVLTPQSFSLSIVGTTNQILNPSIANQTLLFDQFDGSLGVLDSIDFLLSGTSQNERLVITATRGTAGRFTATSVSSISGFVDILGAPVSLPVFIDGIITGNTCSTLITPATSCSVAPTKNGTTPGDYNQVDVTGYVGSGQIPVTFHLRAGRSNPVGLPLIGAQPTRRALLDANWSGTLTVAYNYTPNPVPEPSTYAMGLLGLGLTAAARIRRRK